MLARVAGRTARAIKQLSRSSRLSAPGVQQQGASLQAGKGAQRSRVKLYSSGGGGGGGGGGDSGGGGGKGGGGGEGSGGFSMAGLWAAYVKLLDTYPWTTRIITSAGLNAAGDVMGQAFFEKDKPFDWARFAKFTFLGGALVAPVLGLWYGQLNSMITGTGVGAAFAKTTLDQLFFAPVFVALFISSLQVLDGTANNIGAKLRQDLAPTVIANWGLWIPGQLFNFYFVPASLNLLCSNCISLAWCTYLSWAANKKVQSKDPNSIV